VGISAVVVATAAWAQDKALAAFMRAKLVHSEKTLEGLATEDYALIAKHSQAMSLLCQDEKWSVVRTMEYDKRSEEFRRSVDAITAAAREKDLDAATLAYLDATMKCISCHKYIRKEQTKQ
jgi:cytochrome c556